MIYVPDYTSSKCAYVRNDSTIRVYDTQPTVNSTVNYRDYFYNSHYLFQDGTQTFNNYSTIPTCLSDDSISTSYLYRTDLFDILGSSLIIIGVIWFFVSKLIKTFFRGFKLY